MTEPGFLDQAPDTDKLTDYDKKYFKLYMRLLDAKADGADWKEAVQVLFGLDPDREPERARRMHDSHLARAQWMTEHGYRLLLAEGAGK
ncbi:DNA -binding domain-containing protein [Roseibium sp.]|uniref:DNA -binding domain-containing protein n=1 Tax=Roseibium sp. TaxID=1936156 RepID=UPI003517B91D